ncbi:MarR family winged helix-turn-helix transcriptional regulator [Geodermatophilus nigrescens]
MEPHREVAERSTTDEAVLCALRLAMGISIQAADRIGSISTVQLRAVTVLHQRPGVNLGRLAADMGVSVSVTSRLVDRLVSAGLAVRRSSATSRREISLWLTPAGEQLLRRYDDLRVGEVHARLAQLPADRGRQLLAVLEECVAGLGAPR